MLRGKINELSIITLEKDLETSRKFGLVEDLKIKQKHELASANDRYVVKIKIVLDGELDEEFYYIVQVFLPKSVFDNNLIERESPIFCDDKTCHLKVAGVSDYFDRALLGAVSIDDLHTKSKTKK